MFIPLRYNFRNLFRRRVTTALTALGIGITVGVFVAVMALAEGMRKTFVATGEPLNVLVIRAGSQSETTSIIEPEPAAALRSFDGIARDEQRRPLISIERAVYVNQERRSEGSSNVVIRGMSDAGRILRSQVHLVSGRWFRPGLRELTVSRSIAERFRNCGLGEELRIGRQRWKIVGIFDAGQTAYGSEMWADVGDIGNAFNRPSYTSAILRTRDRAALEQLLEAIPADRRLHVEATTETGYFEKQTKAAEPIRVVGNLIAVVMAIGSAFAAMNTMYAAVAGRTREVAILRVLGFSRRSILLSFLIESLALALAGGIIGALLALPLNGIATGTTNWFSFSEMTFQFRITVALLAEGVAFSLVVGLAGGLLPAFRAARQPTVTALRAL
jgi:putative ABC transport system permease protein